MKGFDGNKTVITYKQEQISEKKMRSSKTKIPAETMTGKIDINGVVTRERNIIRLK